MDISQLNHIPKLSLAYVAFLALSTVSASITSFYNRRLFQKICVVFLLVQGLLIVVKPSFALPSSPNSVELDGLHNVLARVIGLHTLFMAGLLWPSIRGNDATPRVSLMWAWAVGLVIKAMARMNHYHKIPTNSSSLFTEQEFCGATAITVDITWAVLLFFHLATTSSWGGYAASANSVNMHLRVDNLFLLIAGLVTLAFPQWRVKSVVTLTRLDPSHTLLSQLWGASGITIGLISGRAISYISSSDKATFFCARSMLSVLACGVVVYGWLTADIFVTARVYTVLVTTAVVLLNLVTGYVTIRYPHMLPSFMKPVHDKD